MSTPIQEAWMNEHPGKKWTWMNVVLGDGFSVVAISGKPVLVWDGDVGKVLQLPSTEDKDLEPDPDIWVKREEAKRMVSEAVKGCYKAVPQKTHVCSGDRQENVLYAGDVAYTGRLAGHKWSDLAIGMGKDRLQVLLLAKSWAKSHNLPWPVARTGGEPIKKV